MAAWQHGWIDPLRTLPPSQCVACDVSPTTVGRSVGRPEGRQRLRRASWDGTENGPLLDQGWGMGGTCRVKERERKRFTDRSAEAEETTTAAGLWALDWAFGVGGGERGGCGVGRGRAAKKKKVGWPWRSGKSRSLTWWEMMATTLGHSAPEGKTVPIRISTGSRLDAGRRWQWL